MRRRQSDDSSSDEYGPTDLESDYCSSSETDLTDVDDDDDVVNAADKVDDIEDDDDMEGVDDVEGQTDCAYLLADEVHPPEYYLKQIQEFNEFDFSTEDYREGTTRLLDRIEEQWYQ
jgi:hypothetical protein